jgi:type III secretion protein D
MDRAAPSLDSMHALELRVFEGPQGGARAPLAAGQPCVLAAEPDGAGDGADIVLREEKVPPARVRVRADLPQATVEVLSGQVELGDKTLAAGEQAAWPMHTPLKIGSSVVAFGRACIDDWSTHHPAETAAADDVPPAPAGKVPLRRRAEVWLAGMGACVLLACVGAMWMARVAAAPAEAPIDAGVTLLSALRASEFAMLEAKTAADGRTTLRGRLSTRVQRAQLDAWLAERRFAPLVEVWVDEAIAHDVTEVFRVNGVSVRTQVAGAGRIAADAVEPNADKLNRAAEVVRRDVRGLQALDVRNTAKPAPPPAPPVFDDPGKRIASLVPGDPAYLVTADGSRYFIGALLPTGHRITQIDKSRVTLELHGQASTLDL